MQRLFGVLGSRGNNYNIYKIDHLCLTVSVACAEILASGDTMPHFNAGKAMSRFNNHSAVNCVV